MVLLMDSSEETDEDRDDNQQNNDSPTGILNLPEIGKQGPSIIGKIYLIIAFNS